MHNFNHTILLAEVDKKWKVMRENYRLVFVSIAFQATATAIKL